VCCPRLKQFTISSHNLGNSHACKQNKIPGIALNLQVLKAVRVFGLAMHNQAVILANIRPNIYIN